MAGVFSLIFMLVGLALKLVMKLRLMPLLLYIVLMCTVFAEWQHAHQTLAICGLVLIGFGVVVNWIITVVRTISVT